ncbi:MAG: lysophospholipid acyltransferase family protein [Myxococcota bacterium]
MTTRANTELILHNAPTRPGHEDRWPFLKTLGYTLDISVRCLWSTYRGRGGVKRCDELLDWWWRKIFTSGEASLTVEGREHFIRGGAHVVMSNHTSLLDIPAIIGAVPGSVRMVTKQELMRVPLWGRALLASGFIPIDRRNRERAIQQLEKAKETLATGVNVWIAPEGTRSRDGRLAPFKKGGFHTAVALGATIIPTWIDGASDIIPPDQLVARHGRMVTVRFGAPIPTVSRSREDLEPLMQEVRDAILALSRGAAVATEAAQAEPAPTVARGD